MKSKVIKNDELAIALNEAGDVVQILTKSPLGEDRVLLTLDELDLINKAIEEIKNQ